MSSISVKTRITIDDFLAELLEQVDDPIYSLLTKMHDQCLNANVDPIHPIETEEECLYLVRSLIKYRSERLMTNLTKENKHVDSNKKKI
jgi:hypothetical protein